VHISTAPVDFCAENRTSCCIDVTYAALGTYVTEHAFAVAGPVHEIYRVGPRDTPDASAWRTEISWPIFETAGPVTAARRASA
jgi:hypothetical protein